MKINDYARSLPNDLNKKTVVDGLSVARQSLTNVTIPAYSDTVKEGNYIKGHVFKSPQMQALHKRYVQHAPKNHRRYSLIEFVAAGLNVIETQYDWAEKQLAKMSEITKDGLTYNDLSVLRLLDISQGTVEAARRLLLLTYSYELEYERKTSLNVMQLPYTKSEIVLFEDGFGDFIRTIELFVSDSKNLLKRIEDTPTVSVELKAGGVAAETFGESKLDPFRLNAVNRDWNPVWFIRSALTEYQVAQYRKALVEKQALENHILQLRIEDNGQKDPAIEKQIEYYNGLIKDYNYKIEKMEA